MTTIYLAGSGWFGATVTDALLQDGHHLAGVSSPVESRRGGHTDATRATAIRHGIPWTGDTLLRPDTIPAGTDLIIAAHSHAFIGRRTRQRATNAVGYHPSLLPLHRGRDAIRWTIRDHDRVTGGTVYHLTDKVDGGPVVAQDYRFVPAGATASSLWRDVLAPLGVLLLTAVAEAADGGAPLPYHPQDETIATWEPARDQPPVHRPELLELPPGRGWTGGVSAAAATIRAGGR